MGLQQEIGLSSLQYSWLGSIYYCGYMPAVPIHNRLMQRFPPSKYIATCMALWGIVLCTMSACKSFAGLMIQRSFLGFFEGVINSGFMLVTAAWYKKLVRRASHGLAERGTERNVSCRYEHASRVGIWSSCVGLAYIVGGAIGISRYVRNEYSRLIRSQHTVVLPATRLIPMHTSLAGGYSLWSLDWSPSSTASACSSSLLSPLSPLVGSTKRTESGPLRDSGAIIKALAALNSSDINSMKPGWTTVLGFMSFSSSLRKSRRLVLPSSVQFLSRVWGLTPKRPSFLRCRVVWSTFSPMLALGG